MFDERVPLSPRAAEISQVARVMIEEVGVEGLSMRTLADRLGIRAASLYAHFADKRALENAVIAFGLWEQGDYVRDGLEADDPLAETARRYRAWALSNPQTYLLMSARGLDQSAPGVAEAEARPTAVARAAMGGDDPEATAVLWAFCHGMIELELTGRFPPGFDLDALWARGIGAIRTLQTAPSPAAG